MDETKLACLLTSQIHGDGLKKTFFSFLLRRDSKSAGAKYKSLSAAIKRHRQLFCAQICSGLPTHHSPPLPNKRAAHHLCLSFHVPLTGCWEKEGRPVRGNQSFQFISGKKEGGRKSVAIGKGVSRTLPARSSQNCGRLIIPQSYQPLSHHKKNELSNHLLFFLSSRPRPCHPASASPSSPRTKQAHHCAPLNCPSNFAHLLCHQITSLPSHYSCGCCRGSGAVSVSQWEAKRVCQ